MYARNYLLKRISTTPIMHRRVASTSSGSCAEHWSTHWTSI